MIDCDIHVDVPRAEVLFPYLPEYWREHLTVTAFKGPIDSAYPRGAPTNLRPGAEPPDGGADGAYLARVRAQAVDRPGLEYGILNCAYAIESLHHPDQAAVLASAVNDWLIAEWLEKEPRLRASMVVPSQLPELAAGEIERVGGHPGFVQVFLPVRSRVLYGNRLYRPVWEAMVRHDLVAGIQFGGAPGNPPTPSGWPTYYLEEYVGMSQVFESQLASLIAEGVFDLFPTARVALVEGGFTWLPTQMWRLDKEWRQLQRLVPWIRRYPSEYIREHVRATIQPLDGLADPDELLEIVDQVGSDEMLMFASDYPHRHASAPEEVLLPRLPDPLAARIAAENARAFYRL